MNQKKLAAVWTCQPGRPQCQIHVTDLETRQHSPNSSLEGLARKPDAASGRLSSVVGHLGSVLSIYSGERWWQVAALSLPFQKSAACKCEKHTRRHQILTLVFKDTIGGCSHSPCFLDRKQHIKRKEGRRAERLSRFCKGSCNHQGFFSLLRVH